MKTGVELILATKQFAKDDATRSWWYLLSTGFLLAAALALTLLPVHLAARLTGSVLAGLLLLRLFVIYHDQQHHAILPRSRVAEFLMQIFGILALSPSSIWRASHNHHHHHNSKLRGSHIGSYPIMTKEQFKQSSTGKRFGYLFVRHPLTILFGYVFMFLFGMCLNPFLNHPRKHFDCLVALIIHFAISTALVIYGGWATLLITQTLPHFITYAIGSYFFYAQHNFPGVSFSDRDGWTYEKAALESSSYMRMGPLMQWFSANIGFHHIHHLNDHIPFYRLPEVIRAMPELQNPKVTSLHPADIIRCLRLKVWCVETQSMVSLRNV
ncbi:fatty acid desaturase [Nibricoccus aquaticus]|uniref:Fatty acid desaturase n=1 Tax=Nibricoccus aquaticus TaxID=2576891 RepID=A0A290QCK1_9BACT|nr:fatty acid desaturase [Nibricoccus aquaticus]ATC66183.1 fatty acid desaturase [Nibricoccus aquaticus]